MKKELVYISEIITGAKEMLSQHHEKQPSKETHIALTKIEESLIWLNYRQSKAKKEGETR